MDQELSGNSRDPLVVTGAGYEISPALAADSPPARQAAVTLAHDADPLPFLRVKKTAKFMSKQDRMAVAAAACAVRKAGLAGDVLETRTMIAMAVGPIPFQESEAMLVAGYSCQGGEFSMESFCREAYDKVNPMLLFACLPNMPAYHMSANLGIRGGYYLTYPSCAESYAALRNAVSALAEGRIAAVLYGGVADQQNLLVKNHHRKTGQLLPAPDCAAFIVLETLSQARSRNASVLARLQDIRVLSDAGAEAVRAPFYLGPADLPLGVARFAEESNCRSLVHRFQGNGYLFESKWVK